MSSSAVSANPRTAEGLGQEPKSILGGCRRRFSVPWTSLGTFSRRRQRPQVFFSVTFGRQETAATACEPPSDHGCTDELPELFVGRDVTGPTRVPLPEGFPRVWRSPRRNAGTRRTLTGSDRRSRGQDQRVPRRVATFMKRRMTWLTPLALTHALACTSAANPVSAPPSTGGRHPDAGTLQPPSERPNPTAQRTAETETETETETTDQDPIPACEGSPEVLTVTQAYGKRRALRGRQVSVQGVLAATGGACTEEGCGNRCRFAISLRSASPSGPSRRGFALVDGLSVGDNSLTCWASAGDPCDGTEPEDATVPKCAVPLPSAEVVVTGTIATPDDLGSECSPPCSNPTLLSNVSLCVATSETPTG